MTTKTKQKSPKDMEIETLRHRLNLRNVIIEEQRSQILILRDELRDRKRWWKLWER